MTNGAVGGPGGSTPVGLNGIGGGSMTWTSDAKVILLIDMPSDTTTWFGPDSGPVVWGASFTGEHGSTSNCGFLDGHAKSTQTSALHPQQTTDNGSHWMCDFCPNTGVPVNQAGQLWTFWGTNYADPSHQ